MALTDDIHTVLRRHHVSPAASDRILERVGQGLAHGSSAALRSLLGASAPRLVAILDEDGELAAFTALVAELVASLGLSEDDARLLAEPMFSLMAVVDLQGAVSDRLVTRELAAELAESSRIAYGDPRWSAYDVLAAHVEPPMDAFVAPVPPPALDRPPLDPTLDVAIQQRWIAESFGLDDALDPPAPGASISVCTRARPGQFSLVRHASPEPTHCGWVVGCDELEHVHDLGATRSMTVEALVQARPALARFLALPVGVIVVFQRRLIVEDAGGLLVARPGSSVDALDRRDESALAAQLRAALRERIAAGRRDSAAGEVGEAYLVRPAVVDRLLATLDAESAAAELDGVAPQLLREAAEVLAARGKVAAALWLRDRVGGLAAAKRIVDALALAKP